MSSALLICKQDELAKALKEILRPLDFENIDTAASGSEGRRCLQSIHYDLLLINTPLSDEFGTELALDVLEQYDLGVILLVKNELSESVEEKMLDTPVFVLAKPINRQMLSQNLKFVLSSRAKMDVLRQQNQKLQKKLEDVRVLFRAKLCLMQNLGLTEDQAHRYIQKQAMDRRVTPRQAADNLIHFYDCKKH